MRAIILAAGRGSRLNELTHNKPKALTLLKGKPLIEWQIQALKQAGIESIAVVTGYLKDHFAPYGTLHFHNPQWEQTNMLSSLWAAKEWLLEDSCLISYGDIVYDPQIVKDLMGAKASVAIAYDSHWLTLWGKRFEDPLMDAETFRLDANACLTTIGERPKSIAEIQGQYMGLLKFEPEFWMRQDFPEPDWDKLSMTDFLRRRIEKGDSVKAIKNKEIWAEVDSKKDLDVAEEIWGESLSEEVL
jgi:choline kinase